MIVGVVGVPGTTGVLVQTPAPPPGDPAAGRGEEFGKTSPLALVVILLLALATILLIRSMNRRLRNVPASFDRPDGPDGPDGPAGASDDGPRGSAAVDPADESTDSTSGTSELGRTEGPPRAGSP